METPQRPAFAERMHEVCSLLGIPPGHGRQAALGKRFAVTPKAARKWLLGLGYPELELAVAIADAAGVTITWLLQGSLPKHSAPVDSNIGLAVEALVELPDQGREAAIEMLEFQIHRAGGWFTEEQAARYVVALESLRKGPQDNKPSSAA